MIWLAIVVPAIAPGIALLVYFYLKDKYATEPIGLVIKMFLLGSLLVFPTMILQRGLYLTLNPPEWFMAFGLAGGVEEFLKWFLLYYFIFKHKEFEEPYDGIVYAVSLSLGFATVENILYALSYNLGPVELTMRAFLPVSGHALFGVLMGYYFGRAKFDVKTRKYLLLSLCWPILLHGAFDYLFVLSDTYWIWVMLPFMSLLWYRTLGRVHRANARSPYRTLLREE